MEVQEEVMMGSNDQTHIIKGKRTKRQRLSSPLAVTMTMICTSSSGEDGGRVSDYSGGVDRATTASPTTSTVHDEFVERTEEEEDMANCLILLAQGQTRKVAVAVAEPAAAATTSKTATAGFYVYQCKTCDRCFPSFQALGGHRASHKRPKAVMEEKPKTWASMVEEDDQFNHNTTALSLQIPNRGLYGSNKSKVHECSICGAEFSSGQALGGHMRRHRTFTGPPTAIAMPASSRESQEPKKARNILQLDLNLPAPEDDHRDPKFSFVGKEQALVFSASPLVDCHY